MINISIPSRLWYENREWKLTFPDRWRVDNLNSAGFEKPGLTFDQIRQKIEHPIEGPGLEELAKGRRQAVIVIDDMSRPTPAKDIAQSVLDALARAGMGKGQIRFLWALGCHGAHDLIHARKKLGGAIVAQYPVYNHDPFQNLVRAGRTPTGVELWFNREFMACDLKIGIGCITPHVQLGFGGGAKLILPGVAGLESISQFHNTQYRDRKRTGLGNFDQNIMRAECDAAGDAVGLNFKIDCLINRRGEVAGLFAGHFKATHAAGAEAGREHYGITPDGKYDLVVSNAYAKANESAIALGLGLSLTHRGEGTVVLISDAPEGQIPHYLMRAWGSDYGGRHYTPRSVGFVPKFLKKLIVMAPYPDRLGLDMICSPQDAVFVKTWAEVLSIIEADFPGEAKVAVLQDGTMQYVRAGG